MLQLIHLRLLLLQLVELLLQLAGLGEVALLLLLLDLLLEILHRLLMGLGGRFELFLHLLELLGELFLGGVVELASFELFGELLDFFERLFPIALLHGLGRLVGRSGAEVLHVLELLFERILAAQLVGGALRAAWPDR